MGIKITDCFCFHNWNTTDELPSLFDKICFFNGLLNKTTVNEDENYFNLLLIKQSVDHVDDPNLEVVLSTIKETINQRLEKCGQKTIKHKIDYVDEFEFGLLW